MSQVLEPEEYIEQAHLFESILRQTENPELANRPLQETLVWLKQEILATTKLPMAIDYLIAELKHVGTIGSAMSKMGHYFTAFQTYLVCQSEDDHGRFDFWQAMRILHQEALLRSKLVPPSTLFFYQLETLCRNRLTYDHGLEAMSKDPVYDEKWSKWIRGSRHRIGMVDITDLIYVHSSHAADLQRAKGVEVDEQWILFGEKEGRIALANRKRDPLFFFLSIQRHLKYPPTPRMQTKIDYQHRFGQLEKTIERLESRLKFLEQEQKNQGIDLSQYYQKDSERSPDP